MLIIHDEGVEVHKSNGVIRKCDAVIHLNSGAIALYDHVSETYEYESMHQQMIDTDPQSDNDTVSDGSADHISSMFVSPDVVVTPDMWTRVELPDTSYHMENMSLRQRAMKRDDVDPDDINI